LAGAPATIFNTWHQFSEAQEMGRPSFECGILAWSCWPYLQVGLLPYFFLQETFMLLISTTKMSMPDLFYGCAFAQHCCLIRLNAVDYSEVSPKTIPESTS
jgi:hypothetical protein